MNQKFYDLPPEKQRRMVNAGYRVFAQNPYRKAPMAQIAAAAGVSKPLLFHYFRNKLELYAFLWAHACGTTADALCAHRTAQAQDLFELLRRAVQAKCAVMERYPWLWAFAMRAYCEQEAAVRRVVQADYTRRAADALQVMARLAATGLRPGVAPETLCREILWASEGCMGALYAAGCMEPARVRAEYEALICLWEQAYRAERPANPKEVLP